MKRIINNDIAKIKDWREIKCSLATYTGNVEDTEELEGIVINSYETLFGKINPQRQMYDPNCFTKFVNEYFIQQGLNLPLEIQHRDDIFHLAGRALSLKVDDKGFYFIVYIPKTYKEYETVKWLLEERILQGLSKYGFMVDYEEKEDDKGEWYLYIKEMELYSISIVATPCGGVKFESVEELIKNNLNFTVERNAKNNIYDDF